jgi:hypothetical protein
MTDAGFEAAALNVLQNGVDLDNKKRYTEALVCYREGLQLLFDLMKGLYLFSAL